MKSKTLIFILLLFSIQFYNVKSEEAFYQETTFLTQEGDFFLHTVERGQTVYSISKMYNVKVDGIFQLNPGSESGIQAGKQLKIPQESGSYFYHTIQPKETLYSVSKKYYMQGEDIIRANPGLSVETFTIGKIIRIPINQVTTPMEGNEEYNQRITNALLNTSRRGQDIKTIKVALLLPLNLKEGTSASNAAGNRMVEYYEGVLLALEDLKKKGISVNLQIHDTGSKTNLIPSILNKPSMQNLNLIIGGLSDEQIKLISNFAYENNIPYVIPFTSTSDEPLTKYHVYQVNTPQPYLYSKASAAFCNKYKDSNIVFYIPADRRNKIDFIQTVQKDLRSRNISYKEINAANPAAEIENVIDPTKNNVFIPSDDSNEILMNLIAPLKAIRETNPSTSISLFGHPSWQVLSTEHSGDFFTLDATFYSVFYANPTSPAVRSFHNRYISWYSRELINIFPKYGMLGYDTSMFFIQLLDKFGTSYDVNVNKLNYKGIQTDFQFERVNNWGGFINANLYLVEFKPDFKIVSSQIKVK
ncbi:MAG: LysM peptidoglycan-binding domain-containing protein [Bacteroidales bacterium]|nr:LysM peptidoglycan-binding domain-containing protein [Bacteroidales bacterium]